MLPAREAMERAIRKAEQGAFRDAEVWLGIARELRLGELAGRPLPRPLGGNEGPPEVIVTPVARHAEYEEQLAGPGVIHLPAERPAYRDAETEIIGPNRCGQRGCGHAIELSVGENSAGWVHSMTLQAVCPVSHPDQQHTFAAPAMDARG